MFGAFTLLRERPDVVVCYRSAKQEQHGVTAVEREAETAAALRTLGIPGDRCQQWTIPDTIRYGRPEIEGRLVALRGQHDRVFAPAVEHNGHEQHNDVGSAALAAFGDIVTPYFTYTEGRIRSRSDNEVPYDPTWIALKLQALACYRSQHRLWSCAHHFLADQREFYA